VVYLVFGERNTDSTASRCHACFDQTGGKVA
jgi:hypothetical protein